MKRLSWVILLLFAFSVIAFVATKQPFISPVMAKGTTRSADDSSSDNSRSNSTSSRDNSSSSTPTPPKTEEHQTRDQGTSNVFGQIEKRDERRDEPQPRHEERHESPTVIYVPAPAPPPVYIPVPVPAPPPPVEHPQPQPRAEERREPDQPRAKEQCNEPTSNEIIKPVGSEEGFQRRYSNRWFYPYDFELFSSYPYFSSGSACIYEKDTWGNDRRHWRRSYEFGQPGLGSLKEALTDIKASYVEWQAEYVMMHVDSRGTVAMYQNGRYSHTLSPGQFYMLTKEALHRIYTVSFRFTSINNYGNSARIRAQHVFIGPDSLKRTAYLSYHLINVRGRWVIDRMDMREQNFGR